MKEEFDVYGVDFKTRGKRMDEMIEVMRKLWSGEMVEHQGEFYQFERLKMAPPIPAARIPVWVGGISDFALRRAARNDGWLTDLQTSADILESVAKVRSYREQWGRSESFDVMASANDAYDIDGYVVSPYKVFSRHGFGVAWAIELLQDTTTL